MPKTITIQPAFLKQLDAFQNETGLSITYCVNEAVEEWIETTMPMYLSAIRRKRAAEAAAYAPGRTNSLPGPRLA